MTTPKCRLFLIASMPAQDAAALTAAALAAGDVAAVIVPAGPERDATARALAPVVSGSAAVLLLAGEDAARMSRRIGAHGVELTDPGPEEIAAARATLGPEGTIGAACSSRHAAMTAAEAGADYVGFAFGAAAGEDGEPVFTWWQDLFETPCVCLTGLSEEDAAATARAGADFIRPADIMWQSPQTAADAVRRFNLVIADT